MTEPKHYYRDDHVTLYHGNAFEILPHLGITADLIVVDPPYGETNIDWDRWQTGWLDLAAQHATSMWCFGSMRMYFDHLAEYTAAGWRMSQDIVAKDDEGQLATGDVNVVWEKWVGTGFQADRFRRVHEHAIHWHQGKWGDVHHEAQRQAAQETSSGRRVKIGEKVHGYELRRGEHLASTPCPSRWEDDGMRLMTSVLKVKNLRGKALHPTEKPVPLLDPLIRYGCPKDGLVLDLFAGSSSTLDAARQSGRRAIGIEGRELYCERSAKRLSNQAMAW